MRFPSLPAGRAHPGRSLAAVTTTLVVGVATFGVVLGGQAGAAPGCRVDYTVNDWGGGFTAYLHVTNLGDAINGWSLTFAFPGNQRITQGWSANWSQPAGSPNVTATNLDWNRSLGTGAATDIGFNASYTGTNARPASFSINGTVCTGSTPPTSTTTTTSSSTTSTSTSTTTTTPPPPGTHVENPYAGARGYVNPDWAQQVQAEAAATGGTLGQQMARVATNSTAVWMDRIGAITAGRGLRGHLNAALAQQSGTTPVAITIVIYDLPNRDCAALASNGELLVSQNGIARYRTEYIDPIAAILADPAYRNLRIVAIVEPDSLPNLVTNLSVPACQEANSSGAYVGGIQYAINKLRPLSNVYMYLDLAHSGWLGWDSNFGPAADLVTSTVRGTNAGLSSIDGFISNTANYTPVEETFLPNPNLTVGGQPVKSSAFYEWNPYFDELDFAQAMRNAFVSRGFPSGIGMLIDTSRNGWGGSARPTGPSTSTDLNTYVNQSRIDRRPHRGGWCNQSGAGIGARPTASPAAGLDAFVWIKPPGESDGVSQAGVPDPTDPNKKFDPMCDPNAQSRYNSAYPTNALPGAPHAGRWFPAQFRMLVQNAYPVL